MTSRKWGMIKSVIESDSERKMALIRAGEANCVPVEFCRIEDLKLLFGIRRGTAYGLIRDGKIRSVSLRKPGRRLGVRLVHVESVRAHLLSLLTD